MTQLPIGPPTKPPTPLDAQGLQNMINRLGLLIDTRGFDDSMAPAVKNIAETVITQDMPSLLSHVVNETARRGCHCDCDGCRFIHGNSAG